MTDINKTLQRSSIHSYLFSDLKWENNAPRPLPLAAFLNVAGVSDSLLQCMQPTSVRWLPCENPAGVSYGPRQCLPAGHRYHVYVMDLKAKYFTIYVEEHIVY